MNTNDRSEQRAETARQHDDSEIIDEASKEAMEGERHQGRSGGNLQGDVGTQASHERVRDAEAHEGVTKEDDIAHGQRAPVRHPAEHVVTER